MPMIDEFDPTNVRSLFAIVIKLMEGTHWQDRYRQIVEEHYKSAASLLDIDSIVYFVGKEQRLATMTFFAFDDFLTRRFGDNGDENVVTDFVENIFEVKNDRELAYQLGYFKAIRDSRVTIFEVVDIVPDQSYTVRDFVYGGDLIEVSGNRHQADTVKLWQCIAGRLVDYDEAVFMSPLSLPFDQQMVGIFLKELEQTVAQIQQQNRRTNKANESKPLADGSGHVCRNDVLADLPIAAMISNSWNQTLDQRGETRIGLHPPTLGNIEGGIAELIEAVFRVVGNRKQIAQQINELPWAIKCGDHQWNWGVPLRVLLEIAENKSSDSDNDWVVDETVKDDDSIQWTGLVELDAKYLRFWATSKDRSDVGIKVIKSKLGKQISLPLTTSMDTGDLASIRNSPNQRIFGKDRKPIPQAVFEVFSQTRELFFAKSLDIPSQDYNGKTPREMANSVPDRRKALEWLKMRECTDQVVSEKKGCKLYDFGWMWDELGFDRSRD